MLSRDIIVNSNCYHGFTLEEAVKGLVGAGFHNIELTATKGWTEHVFPSMSFSHLSEIRAMLKAEEVKVLGFSGHCNLMDKERLKDFADNIHLAHFFLSPIIVSSVGEAHLEDQNIGGDEIVAENINTLIPLLDDYDMTLVLETHGKHGTASRLRKITELVNSKRVGVCYDTANAVFYGDVKGVEDVEANADVIRYIHIKDKAGGRTEWNFPALGKGYIDFPSILSALDERGNVSPLSVEIEFTSCGAKDVVEVDTALKDSAAYLKTLGYAL